MPAVRKGEKRNAYVKRAVQMLMDEGLTKRQEVCQAEGLFYQAKKKKKKKRGEK